MLKLHLFGPPRIELNGSPIALPRRKAMALLVYLAVTGRPHSRDTLATLLYPEQDQSRARTYFRRDLGELNSQIPGSWLQAGSETVSLPPNKDIWIDIIHFRQQAASPNQTISTLTAAAELYTDHFLAGFSLPDSPEFDEWQFFETESGRQALAVLLQRLIKAHETQQTYQEAIPHARRWVNLDPLHEPAHRQLMTLYALDGQQSAALRQYELCLDLLQQEFDVPPEEETTRLYQTIKARRLTPADVPTRQTAVRPLPKRPLPQFLTTDQPQPAPEPFVGRQRELDQLQAALQSVQAGQGQIRFVIGEAGQGKSTLLRAFARQAREQNPELVVASGDCKAITGFSDPYLPFRELLLMLIGEVEARWAGGLISQNQARQLWELMPHTLPALVKHGPDLIHTFLPASPLLERAADLGQTESPWFSQLATLAGDQTGTELDQNHLVAQYTAVLKAIARIRPLLLIIEDLHWVDTASSGLLFHLSRTLTDSPILLVGTYRPEEIPARHANDSLHPLPGILSELKRTHGDIRLDLGQQSTREGQAFVEAFLDTEPNRLGEKFRVALFERTGGQPLFTAELLRSMQERGDIQQDENGAWVESMAVDWQTLPSKVEGVIERRLERLDDELQAILNIASVEGQTFTAEVVARASQWDERPLALTLSQQLDKGHRLIKAQEIRWLTPGQQRLSLYRFQHQLFQNYLYNHLDNVERVYLQQAVGEALEQLYQGQTEAVANRLAHHFHKAGLTAKAITYSEQACDAAIKVRAYSEAVGHITQAIELAVTAELSPDTLAPLYIRLGGLLIMTKGDGAPEVGRAYQRARDLSKQTGQTRNQFEALRGLALFQRHRMETDIADQLTRDMCDLSQQLQDPALIIEASFALGSQSFFSGDHLEAQVNLARSIETYNPQEHQALAHLHGQDPGVASLAYAAINDWMLGYPDQARDTYTKAISLATEIDHAYSLAMAHNWASWTSIFLREPESVLEHSQAAIHLAEKHNFPLFQAIGTSHYGWALAQMGQGGDAIAKMEQGLADAIIAWGSDLSAPPFLALLADTYGRFNQPQKAMTTLKQAFTLIDQIKGSSWAESELYRLKGSLSQTAEYPPPDIQAHLQQAIQIARAQSAKSLELRAAVNLAQFWQSQGEQGRAHEMLTAVYSWFTEGAETADLQEARALLDTLT